jgi:uroporphyrinogen-III synthase
MPRSSAGTRARSSGRAPGRASSNDGRALLRVLITRPRPQALELARRLEAQGDIALIEPLLRVEPILEVPDLKGVQAILLTSANAVPALSEAAKRLPVFAVGAATAAAARRAGCPAVVSAGGAGEDLARLVAGRCRPDGGALLHLCGEQVATEPAASLIAAGFALRRRAVYRTEAADALLPGTAEALRRREVDAVLLLSPRTARTFALLVGRHGLEACLGATAAICLSAAVAEPCRALVWQAIHTAARPELSAVLEVLEAARRRC